ncbi:MAG TPA: endolytic transglycosylase MltG [Hyphomicrobiaceae bacterium]|nr:endolytic transglycosylase MltG [Hyphomicrobiaceae bacterium]
MRFVNAVLTLVLVLMVAAGAAAYVFDSQIDAPGPLERNKVVVIPKGEGTQEIATRLEREGIIADRRLFVAGYLWAKVAAWMDGDKAVQLKAGDFEIRQNASIKQVVDTLSEGRTVTYKVTVPEGLTSHQIVERLKADQGLSGEITSVPAEGSLLPETFVVPRGYDRQTILDNMAAQSKQLAERLWSQRKKDLPIKSWDEAVILASIVEKETGRNDERQRVAAVFHNRLRLNMRLQSDPTILYGLQGGKVAWGRPILRSEIEQKTNHNTYQMHGLPQTPICNPGRRAIEAVLNPSDTKELYFVADGAGGHVFSETLKDHNTNVSKWRATERETKAEKAEKEKAKAGTVRIPPTTLPYTNAPGSNRNLIRIPPAKEQSGEQAAEKAAEKPEEKAPEKAPEKAAVKAADKEKAAEKTQVKKAPPKETLPWAQDANKAQEGSKK